MKWPDDEVGPPLHERRDMVATLDAEIAKLELQENELQDQARSVGITIG